MFPHALRHNKASGRKAPAKGQRGEHASPKTHKAHDVLTLVCEGCVVGLVGIQSQGEFNDDGEGEGYCCVY